MHYLVGKYLMDNEHLFVRHAVHNSSNKAMVIVETRPNFWLPWVIANAVRVVGWDLYVFGTDEVLEYISAVLINVDYHKVLIPRMNIQGYSRMLMSNAFWNAIQAEHILIFQTDCVLVRPIPDELLKWDYLGAVCGLLDERTFVINGGLSLRRKSAMLKAIDFMTDNDRCEAEDIVFTRVLRLMRKCGSEINFPDMKTCNAFAMESMGDPNTVVGIHATDKFYAPTEYLKETLSTK